MENMVLKLIIGRGFLSPRARDSYRLSPQWRNLKGCWLIDLSDYADESDFFVDLFVYVGQIPGRYRLRRIWPKPGWVLLGSIVYDAGELIGKGGYWFNRRCTLARYFAERADRQFIKQVRGGVLQEKAALGLHLWEFPE